MEKDVAGEKILNLQTFFFKEALAEIGLNDHKIKVNHDQGICFHPELGVVPLVFPIWLVKRARSIPKTKIKENFFMGKITESRRWICKYSGVTESLYGRDPEKKFNFHEEYYKGLCEAKFTLTPTGDCPWSYRFFEAVMCQSIPVLSDTEADIFAGYFFFFRDSQLKKYSENHTRTNYDMFIKRHTLQRFLKL